MYVVERRAPRSGSDGSGSDSDTPRHGHRGVAALDHWQALSRPRRAGGSESEVDAVEWAALQRSAAFEDAVFVAAVVSTVKRLTVQSMTVSRADEAALSGMLVDLGFSEVDIVCMTLDQVRLRGHGRVMCSLC